MAVLRPYRVQRGTTLIEVAVSTVLVGLLLVASLETVGAAMRSARGSAEGLDALTLAQQLIEEVATLPYDDPEGAADALGTEPDEGSYLTRAEVDDLDDLDGWSASPPEWEDGSPITGYEGWTRSIAITRLKTTADASSQLEVSPDGDLGLKRVVVTVTSSDGESASLTLIRSRDGAMESPPALTTDWVRTVQTTIQTGTSDPLILGGALTNEAGGP